MTVSAAIPAQASAQGRDISLDIAQKRVKNHIVPNDDWTFTAQVTSRQAK